MQNVFRMDAIKTFFKEVITFNVVDGYNDTYSYNGIMLEESSVAFQKKLQCLYEDALMEIPLLNNDVKNGFVGIIDRYKECQNGFDVPDELCLTSMNKEIVRGNRNPQLIKQRDFVQMLRECVSLQKYYLNEFAIDIGYTSEEQQELLNQPQTLSDTENTNGAELVDEGGNDKQQGLQNQSQTLLDTENMDGAELVDEDGNDKQQEIQLQSQTLSDVETEEGSEFIDGDWAYQYKGIRYAFKWGRNKVAKFLKDPYYSEAIVQEGRKITVSISKARELMQKREQERKSPKRKK
jgi:hypothetical protein